MASSASMQSAGVCQLILRKKLIARRRSAHVLKYPDSKVIILGIGDTTEPIPEVITSAMAMRTHSLATFEGYSGYGTEQGDTKLRAAIASTYYKDLVIEETDIFVSDGAKCDISRLQVAIEISSFSKYAGFTGVRLGWTVIPKELLFSDGFPVAKDFNRIVCSCFNGASNSAQAGGLACLSPVGLKAMRDAINFYKENTKIILDTFNSLGFNVYGWKNAPYVLRFLRRHTSLLHPEVDSDPEGRALSGSVLLVTE